MHALHHARAAVEIVNELAALFPPFLVCDDEIRPLSLAEALLGVVIHVAVGVPCQHDGALPGRNVGADPLTEDGRAEHGAVEDAADGAVGAFPHLAEAVFLDALRVCRDGGTLDGDAVFFCRQRAFDGHGIARLVAVF